MAQCCDAEEKLCGSESEEETLSVELSELEDGRSKYGPLSPTVPHPDASYNEWASQFPISELPSMPGRGMGYFTEPIIGICTVLIFSALFVGVTFVLSLGVIKEKTLAAVLITLIVTWACIAVGSVLYILIAAPNEIKRSNETCYPIPEEVTSRLLEDQDLDGVKNPKGRDGRTYCVRCLVWRPAYRTAGRAHHCKTCQRCVTHFDHHCGVFGRCIVKGNMPCFYAMISMLFFGMVTTGLAALFSSRTEPWNKE